MVVIICKQLDAEAENTTVDLDDDSKTGPDIFGVLSDDADVGDVSPWKFEMTNPFDHKATYVTIRSNLWPGAYAVTREKYVIPIFLHNIGYNHVLGKSTRVNESINNENV